ncbi:hypothetical protein [Paracoccus tegillarcae]|uniref:hypothetical protein n=1 Tax=Paracoccus tegillarcae TaxID=1529068 RepID=UPI00130041F0|nr:hypothetical protein [Paracoccus tegillarcae]
MTGDIAMVVDVLRASHHARRRMQENLMIAARFNAMAVPLAVLGFALPLIAAIAMSTSSVTATLNAQRVSLTMTILLTLIPVLCFLV